MGSLFRSQQMVLCQIFLQNESAYSSVSNLGELGLVQFRDTNPTVSAFQRKFITQVRRCDEMERKLIYVEKEILNENIKLDDVTDNPTAPQPKEIVDLEATFEKLESELREVNSNSDALKKTYFELTELKNVLVEAQTFFSTQEAPVESMDSSTLVPNEVPASAAQHGFVIGVILRERIPGFEMMLWRVCRGKVFLRQAEISTLIEDPFTGEKLHKVVFILFFQGDQLKSRVKKICEGFHATLYPCPDNYQEREDMLKGVKTRIEDLNQPFKSAGPDDIIPALLQKGVDIITPHLCRIYRSCLVFGFVPYAWRTCKVIFIPKPGKLATVYQAETLAMLACVNNCLERGISGKVIRIFSGSQAVLKALNRDRFSTKTVWECHNALIWQEYTKGTLAVYLIATTPMSHALLDVCKAMLPYLDASRVKQLYELCKPLLEHENRTTQKKSFGVMNEICIGQSEACCLFVREHFEDLRPILCGTTKGLTPATKALRLSCLQCIVNHLTKDDMETIVLISAEAVICTKENSIKARTAAFGLLVAIGHTLKRIMPGDAKGALQEYMKILLAGLAGRSTHLIGATILAIGRVMFEFKDDVDGELMHLLVENVCLLITSKSREVVVAALSFFKILFAVLHTTDLLRHVSAIVQSVTNISEENQRQLRFKAKELFTRLVRKFGYEMIYKMVPDSHKKQVSNIRKLEARKHKKREDDDDEEEGVRKSKKADTFEDILADSDDELLDEEEAPKRKKTKHPKRRDNPMIEECGEDDIVDFMDPAVNKRLLTKRPHKPSETKKGSEAFPISEDGRLIIKDEDEKPKKDKKSDELLPLKELGLADKKRKRKHEDSDEEDEDQQGTSKGIHRFDNRHKRRLPGEEFKATKAGGDVKKGKVDPYAYVPFNRQALNKRKNVKLKGQYKNIVQAAKKGANIGVKRKMREAKKRKNKRR
ncbi:RRP12-like protein [Uloborus diversus]|uniref:RRP12-like protein n=1 Tax=Uloborus diversus TaxID=327109 RepID=UPI002409BAB3|nr:RRP12-like protein [Uloborus diversus]